MDSLPQPSDTNCTMCRSIILEAEAFLKYEADDMHQQQLETDCLFTYRNHQHFEGCRSIGKGRHKPDQQCQSEHLWINVARVESELREGDPAEFLVFKCYFMSRGANILIPEPFAAGVSHSNL